MKGKRKYYYSWGTVILFLLCFAGGYVMCWAIMRNSISREVVEDAIEWRDRYAELQDTLYSVYIVIIDQDRIIRRIISLEEAIKKYDSFIEEIDSIRYRVNTSEPRQFAPDLTGVSFYSHANRD